MKYPIAFFLFLATTIVNAQDKIILNNGDAMNGDIKHLDNGVIEVETDYSEDNFTMDWESISELSSPDTYMINLADGQRLTGTINITNKQATITTEESSLSVDFLEVVYIKSVDDGFWDRMSISIDGGFSSAKANSNKQLTLSGNAAYLSEKINPSIYFNFVEGSSNDGTSEIVTSRDNYGGDFKVFIYKSWFGTAGLDFLSSNEQSLDLRSTYSLGFGTFLIRNFKMYLSTAVGGAWNKENYDAEAIEPGQASNTNSSEAFAHIDYNAFGLNDVSINSQLKLFPSLSESGRIRVNYDINVKFDLPRDFYIGAGYTLTYDSEPISTDLANSDYVISTTLGWSL